MDYNPLKGMVALISSLKLSTVPYAASPESRSLEDNMDIYRCQTASQVSLFVGFLISWISLPTKTTKIGTPRIKVISQYLPCFIMKGSCTSFYMAPIDIISSFPVYTNVLKCNYDPL